MQAEPHKVWEEAKTRCCDNWRECFQRAMQLADAPARAPLELCLLQANWLAANVERSFDFWSQLLQAAGETEARVFGCLFARMQAIEGDFARLREQIAQAAASGDAGRQETLAAMLNAAYSEWLARTGESAPHATSRPARKP
jgi:hypothetical protein